MPKVTTICVGVEDVTVPVAPRLNVTPVLEAKPKPLIVTVLSVVWMEAVLEVTTGVTAATGIAAPLLTVFVVTTAVKVPAVVGLVPKVTVSEVLVALVTVPVAPLLKVTRLFAGVVLSKPAPWMVTVVALAATAVLKLLTTGVIVATWTAVPLLTPSLVMVAFKTPAMSGEGRLTPNPVDEAAVTVPGPVPAPLKVTPSLSLLESKPKPLMEIPEALAARLALLGVITGMTVATCTALPLERLVEVLVTMAVSDPRLVGGVVSVTVSEVVVAVETVPTAP